METDSEPEEIASSDEEESPSEESETESNLNEKSENSTPKKSLISSRVVGTRTKNMSLEELIKMRDRIGTKQFNQQVLKSRKDIKESKHKAFKRENKNRPQELSSKSRVPKIRQVIQASKNARSVRDPRFDNLCGTEYDEELFDKRYEFLEQIREREKKSLKKQLVTKKSKNTDKQTLKYLLNRMEQQDAAKKDRQTKREKLREWKKEERDKVAQGIKKPYFLKKSDKKKMFMEMNMSQRKEKGTLAKIEARKEKKKKSKESRVMPYQRRSATTQ